MANILEIFIILNVNNFYSQYFIHHVRLLFVFIFNLSIVVVKETPVRTGKSGPVSNQSNRMIAGPSRRILDSHIIIQTY